MYKRQKQDGFLGRQIFYNQKTGEALLLVKWKNRNLWKNISDEEVNKMQKRYPEWVNTEVIMKAMKMREEGILSERLNMWIENLLEINQKK